MQANCAVNRSFPKLWRKRFRIRGANIFQKSRSHLKLLCTRQMTILRTHKYQVQSPGTPCALKRITKLSSTTRKLAHTINQSNGFTRPANHMLPTVFTIVSVDSRRRTSCWHCCYLGLAVREIKGFGSIQLLAEHRTFCCICSNKRTESQPPAPTGHSPRPLGCLILDTTYCPLEANRPAYRNSGSLGSEQDSSFPACDAVYTHFREPKGSLQCTQQPVTGPYP